MHAMDEGNYCGACHDDSMAFSTESYCGSCHLSPQEPVVWTKPVKAVLFSHDNHSEDMGMDCESCHNDLFIMEAGAAQENEDFNHTSMDEGNYCGACHDGSTAFSLRHQMYILSYRRSWLCPLDRGGCRRTTVWSLT